MSFIGWMLQYDESGLGEDILDAGDESSRIELGADDVVGAVGEEGDAPVADESHKLTAVPRLNLGAKVLRFGYAFLTFHVDQHKRVRAGGEEGNGLADDAGRVDVETGVAENLVAQRTQHLSLADVKDHLWIGCGCGWNGVGHGDKSLD